MLITLTLGSIECSLFSVSQFLSDLIQLSFVHNATAAVNNAVNCGSVVDKHYSIFHMVSTHVVEINVEFKSLLLNVKLNVVLTSFVRKSTSSNCTLHALYGCFLNITLKMRSLYSR